MMRKNNCYNCKHKVNVPGSAHVQCSKPIPDMEVDLHGLEKGWAFYPLNFDPIWLIPPGGECRAFLSKDAPETLSSKIQDLTVVGPYEDTCQALDALESMLRKHHVTTELNAEILQWVKHFHATTFKCIADLYKKRENKDESNSTD